MIFEKSILGGKRVDLYIGKEDGNGFLQRGENDKLGR